MKRAAWLAVVGLALSGMTGVAQATTWFEVTVKCPIGGKSFKSAEMGSNSYFGQRPDGRPYSPSPIPPIDECPDNGFVIFDSKLSKAAIAQLTPLVASSEYQALRTAETRHYRAWWLMERIQRDPYERAIRLMFAGWETDHEPERKARYQAQFAAAALALEWSAARLDDWFWLRLRAANALRETGRFAEAEAAIDATWLPERLPADPEQQQGAKRYAEGLRALLRDRNRHAEPANLIPPRAAVERCEATDLSGAELAACDSAEVQAERDELRKWREAEGQPQSDSAADAAAGAAEAAAAAAAAAAEAAADAAQAAERAARAKRRKPD